MKLIVNLPRRPHGHCAAGRAFTLPELMIVMAIFSLVFAGLISAQIFGMRMLTISETKLSATATGRRALNAVRDEIRAGKILVVGNGNDSTFTPIADNTPQIGNALQIHSTTNTANFVRYYLDQGEERLKRVVSGSSNIQVVANFITNELAFSAEDFCGNVQTRNRNNRVIRLNLEFYQWGYPIASVGSGGMYDYYHLQTRISRRTIE